MCRLSHLGMFSDGSTKCRLDNPNIHCIHILGFPFFIHNMAQELGCVGRQSESSLDTDTLKIFHIEDFVHLTN